MSFAFFLLFSFFFYFSKVCYINFVNDSVYLLTSMFNIFYLFIPDNIECFLEDQIKTKSGITTMAMIATLNYDKSWPQT